MAKEKELVVIPDFPRYRINEVGVLYDTLECAVVPYFFSEDDGYAKVAIKNAAGKTVLTSRHRLMALTFLPIPETDDVLIVNHKNGIKGDDRLGNLEWTTYQGNSWHAGLHQLTAKCIPVVVRDVLTGNETTYPSVLATGLALGLSKDAVLWRIQSDGKRVFPEMRLYKKLHSNTPWVAYDPKYPPVFGRSREVVVKFLTTGEYRIYDSARLAAKAVGCTDGAMSQWLNKLSGYPVLPGLVQVRFASDETEFPEVDDPWCELAKHTKNKPVFCFNQTTGVMSIFESAASCARHRGVSVTNMSYKLASSGRTLFKDGYRYGYYPDNTGSVLPATVK